MGEFWGGTEEVLETGIETAEESCGCAGLATGVALTTPKPAKASSNAARTAIDKIITWRK